MRAFLVKKFSYGILQAGHQISIQIHCDLDRGVSKSFGNDLRLDIPSDQHRCMGVPEIMERRLWYSGSMLLLAFGIYFIHQTFDRVGIYL